MLKLQYLLSILLVAMLFIPFCYSKDCDKEASKITIEKRIQQIFNKKDADTIALAHKTYLINLDLIKLIFDLSKENDSIKRTLNQYKFSPTDENLRIFYKEAERIIDKIAEKNPGIGDWKYYGRHYGGLSSIVYIHIYNYPEGVPADLIRKYPN